VSNFSQEDYPRKNLDLTAVLFKAKMMRLRACKMRIDALRMRIRTRAIHEQNQNLLAIYQEWSVK